MMPDGNLPEDKNVLETPIERAGRLESEENQKLLSDEREEHQADLLIKDIDEYVLETDNSRATEAEKELDAWEIPVDPLEEYDLTLTEGPLVPVYTAQTEAEGNIISGVLQAAGIPCTFDNYAAPVLGNAISTGEARWADVMVPEEYVDAAKQAIQDAATQDDTTE